MLRLNYDAHNGHPYTAVGRILIERNIVPREEMSMDRIQRMDGEESRSGQGAARHNKSFVFFRITGLDVEDGAAGRAGRAADAAAARSRSTGSHVYGTPFFIDAELPIDRPRSRAPNSAG